MVQTNGIRLDGRCARKEMGWRDLVDMVPVDVFIARAGELGREGGKATESGRHDRCVLRGSRSGIYVEEERVE